MPQREDRRRVVIMGAAGRDFHNFNLVYRHDTTSEVVAFTAAQIPYITGRRYPPSLAGPLYPDGIPVVDEAELTTLCQEQRVQRVVFAYSDVPHDTVMHAASRVLASGADFLLLGPSQTMVRALVPVIAISAVRTGCGKSQTARWISLRLRQQGLRTAVIRHPMPYGDLEAQAVQRFAELSDLDRAECTVEEREEYEPHLRAGNLVYAGVDYAAITERAQAEADLLLWDGGNNDLPFIRPDLHVVLVDALRPGHGLTHHPGEAVLRTADAVVVTKVNSASTASVREAVDGARRLAPQATVVRAASPVRLETPERIVGQRVLVIEDGPTLTHGGMPYGAGYVAASEAGAAEIVDPRDAVSGELAHVFRDYPHIGPVLPALGYSREQLASLAATIERSSADVVVSGTPCDLRALLDTRKPVVRAFYDFAEVDEPGLGAIIDTFVRDRGLAGLSATADRPPDF
jgi:predicted GTPase